MSNRRRDTIEELRRQLETLEIAAANIRTAIEELSERGVDPNPPVANLGEHNPLPATPVEYRRPRILDRNGRQIEIGDTVTFLTRGRYSSTSGIVTRFSRNGERVFARDNSGNEIARAPRNVRVTGNQ